jgi:hypothetical protein
VSGDLPGLHPFHLYRSGTGMTVPFATAAAEMRLFR